MATTGTSNIDLQSGARVEVGTLTGDVTLNLSNWLTGSTTTIVFNQAASPHDLTISIPYLGLHLVGTSNVATTGITFKGTSEIAIPGAAYIITIAWDGISTDGYVSIANKPPTSMYASYTYNSATPVNTTVTSAGTYYDVSGATFTSPIYPGSYKLTFSTQSISSLGGTHLFDITNSSNTSVMGSVKMLSDSGNSYNTWSCISIVTLAASTAYKLRCTSGVSGTNVSCRIITILCEPLGI